MCTKVGLNILSIAITNYVEYHLRNIIHLYNELCRVSPTQCHQYNQRILLVLTPTPWQWPEHWCKWHDVVLGLPFAHCLCSTGPSKHMGQWGEINDQTCPWVGSNKKSSVQKSSTLPLDYRAHWTMMEENTIKTKKHQKNEPTVSFSVISATRSILQGK